MAATLNWRNSSWGYWINFATVGIADTGFIFFVHVPGHAPVWPNRNQKRICKMRTLYLTCRLPSSGKTIFAEHDYLVIPFNSEPQVPVS
jgi:hypothetical protein